MDTIEQNCCFCLSAITQPTRNKQCSHIYCFECIDNWIKTKDECPICKSKINELITIDDNGKERTIAVEEPKKPSPDSVEVDLACLDNRFFLEETQKLLSISHSIVLQMESLMSTEKKVYYTPTMSPQDTERLNTITDRLYTLQKDLENYENAFDPEDLLSTFYIFETTLTDLKEKYLSEFLNKNKLKYSNSKKKNHHHYINEDDDEDYDEDEYIYDDDDIEESLYNQIESNNNNNTNSNNNKNKLKF
ncbi:hypothetical protein DICPUDRAFT_87942 [Dictyostelium purpureum]|uniref:RING-type domain-containing protein n=1 Tax=Dictyostelium purpureum TaxID=5786 RepID=F0ZLD0_DICPU|nr:uncharacterized protein DICPUDRAFT_87942 [Dictyostelium purpureum]EGC35248.1 hypothetical protein DICPUDRAFT_87942 [Dictyostelium purpureum]|eukprot:XP_003288235.1 hypothetical protein DICPUDRAFT_87942 [Dictyostelium purpureum]